MDTIHAFIGQYSLPTKASLSGDLLNKASHFMPCKKTYGARNVLVAAGGKETQTSACAELDGLGT